MSPQSKRSKKEAAAEAKQEEPKQETTEEQPEPDQQPEEGQDSEEPQEPQKDESPSQPQPVETNRPAPEEHIQLRESQVSSHNERTGGGKVREGELQAQLDEHNRRVSSVV